MVIDDAKQVTRSGREFFARQIALLKPGRTDELVETQYCIDARLFTLNGIVTGTSELKKYFHDYLKRLGSIDVKSIDRFLESRDSLLLEATVQTNLGEARVYDAFVLRDGRIAYHFTGMK